jgi:hypothetical protein
MADDVLCAGCGLDLAEVPGPRGPCPRCGETVRVFTASASLRGSGSISASAAVHPPTVVLKVDIPSPDVEAIRKIAAHFEHVLDEYLPTPDSGEMWLVVLRSRVPDASLPIVVLGDDRAQARRRLLEALEDEL